MGLTQDQLATFSTDIENNTDQVIIDARVTGSNNVIQAWYNSEASPGFYVWRIIMPVQEMRDEHFDWAEIVSSLTTNSLLALQVLINQINVDPSKSTIRDAFQEIFSGPQLATTRGALLAGSKRLATNVQILFADTSGGDGTEGTPATAVVELVTLQDVRDAVALI